MKSKLKRLVSALLLMAIILPFAGCSVENTSSSGNSEGADSESGTGQKAQVETLKEGEDYHIGIVTGTVAQGEDEYRAGQDAVEKYGDANDGGIIVHDTYPDNFMAEQETTISKIVAMADDPKMKAIIVNQSVPGTSAAFQQVREKNPNIILIGLTPQEDTSMIENSADLAMEVDHVSRGYRIIKAAKEMGATKFVHISFPRHMSIELLALRREIMKEACKDLGVEFISQTAPDPTSDVGIPGAQQYIAENIPNWIDQYGKDTAFFCTNDAHTEPLLRGIAEGGAIFVEQDLPSPIMGYPGAFSVDLSKEAGDWEAINKKVEDAVVEAGGSGRMGTWAYSSGYTSVLAACDLVQGVLKGEKELTNLDDIKDSLEKSSKEGIWDAIYYTDRNSGQEKTNHVLISEDTYVYGKGYLGVDKEPVPDKYLNLNVNLDEIVESESEAQEQSESTSE